MRASDVVGRSDWATSIFNLGERGVLVVLRGDDCEGDPARSSSAHAFIVRPATLEQRAMLPNAIGAMLNGVTDTLAIAAEREGVVSFGRLLVWASRRAAMLEDAQLCGAVPYNRRLIREVLQGFVEAGVSHEDAVTVEILPLQNSGHVLRITGPAPSNVVVAAMSMLMSTRTGDEPMPVGLSRALARGAG